MSEAARVSPPMTIEEFLDWDSGDEFVWELIDGYPQLKFPPNPDLHGQAAPSDEHGVIVQNLAFVIETVVRAKRRPCRVIAGAGQPVSRRRNRERFRIPDLVVKCGESVREARDPILIAEVVSPSNRASIQEERAADFRSLPTVLEFVVLEQNRPVVTRHRRVGDLWRFDRFEGLDAVLELESVDLAIPLTDLYRGVLAEAEG